MCTVTWLLEEERLALFANRDELRTRKRALPPRRHSSAGGHYLAPVDGDAGGTWVAVNATGLVLCLLNDYRSAPPGLVGDFISRGRLVAELIDAPDLNALEERWSALVWARYRPFRLLALAAGSEPRLLCWNGSESSVERETVEMPLCSSSFDDRGAARTREELLSTFQARIDLEPDKRLLRFHQSHLPERGPYSVCMHRPDAVTVSFTLVEVDADRVSMAYAGGSPCTTPLENLVTLDRTPL